MRNISLGQKIQLDAISSTKIRKECYLCSEKSIKSHSIQKKIFDNFAVDGFVYAVDRKKYVAGDLISKQGIKKATTFPGFCGDHDSQLFSTLENGEYDLHDHQNAFLLAYRSFAKEYSEKIFLRAFYKKASEIIKANYSMHFDHSRPYSQYKDMNQVKEYYEDLRSKLNESLKDKDFTCLKYAYCELPYYVGLSISTMYYPEFNKDGSRICNPLFDYKNIYPMVFNLIPINGVTKISFAYFTEHADNLDKYLDDFLTANEMEQRRFLNGVMAYHSENFVISPKRWEILSDKSKQNFVETWESANDLTDINPWNYNGTDLLNCMRINE
jgi:hypothetical protein